LHAFRFGARNCGERLGSVSLEPEIEQESISPTDADMCQKIGEITVGRVDV